MSPFAILAALLASPSCCWQVTRQKGFKNELLRAERFDSEYGVLVLGVFRLRVKRMRTLSSIEARRVGLRLIQLYAPISFNFSEV